MLVVMKRSSEQHIHSNEALFLAKFQHRNCVRVVEVCDVWFSCVLTTIKPYAYAVCSLTGVAPSAATTTATARQPSQDSLRVIPWGKGHSVKSNLHPYCGSGLRASVLHPSVARHSYCCHPPHSTSVTPTTNPFGQPQFTPPGVLRQHSLTCV